MAQDTGIGIKDLVAALSSFDDLPRVEARKALVAMGSKAVPFLVEALKGPHILQRWEAAKALEEIVTTLIQQGDVEPLSGTPSGAGRPCVIYRLIGS